VIGGGHAGTEACTASARVGARTLLLTQRIETIGEMSCNPSFGGIGKGVLLREIDALDGISPRICDKAGIHFRMLNTSKGPAVQGPRAQIDRVLYKKHVQEWLQRYPNLTIMEAEAENLLYEPTEGNGDDKFRIKGVLLCSGTVIEAKNVVITTGTFLGGEIHIGK